MGLSIKKGLYGGKRTLFSFDLSSATYSIHPLPQKKSNSPCFRKVVFQVGIPQGVAFSISYIEADR